MSNLLLSVRRISCSARVLIALFGAWMIAGVQSATVAQSPAADEIRIHRDIAYTDNPSPRQKLDLYLPAESSDAMPLVVWIHGGGWALGSKDNISACRWVLNHGFAVASIGYRLTDEAVFPAQLEDCRNAISRLRRDAAEYNIDPNRIVVWGASAGGHLSAMTALAGDPDSAEDDISGAVNWFGPAELLTMQRQRTLPTPLNADAPDSFESRLIGGTLQEHPEKAEAASPVRYCSPDDPPMLIMHGDKDALVPLQQSRTLQKKLEASGVACELVVLEGAGHGGPQFNDSATREKILSFLRRCVNSRDHRRPQN